MLIFLTHPDGLQYTKIAYSFLESKGWKRVGLTPPLGKLEINVPERQKEFVARIYEVPDCFKLSELTVYRGVEVHIIED